MNARTVQFYDVSFTDGQSAVWGGGLRTSMMAAAFARLAAAGLAAIEVLSPAVIAADIARGENPLQRLQLAQRCASGVPLRVVVNLLADGNRNANRMEADIFSADVIGRWMEVLAAHGATQVVVLDPLLHTERMAAALQAAVRAGLTPIAALSFCEDAERNDAWYVKQAENLLAGGAARIMLRDESGVLNFDRIRTLVPALRTALGDAGFDLHTRCQTGLGPYAALEAGRLGVDGIDCALPCLANGASAPALPNYLQSASYSEVAAADIDCNLLAEADAMLRKIADQEGFAAAACWAFELSTFAHQLPGEVASEFLGRLRTAHRWHELQRFANECATIRREMGAPPMVQPFARAIAEQAWSHLEGGERYRTLQPVLRRVLQGIYGLASTQLALQRRVGSLPQARTLTLEQLRSALPDMADADRLLRHMSGATDALPAQVLPDYAAVSPEQVLMNGLLRYAHHYQTLTAQGPGMSIQLNRQFNPSGV